MGPGVEYHAKVSGFVIRGYSRVMFTKDQAIRFFLFTIFLSVLLATSGIPLFFYRIICERLLHLRIILNFAYQLLILVVSFLLTR